MDDRLVLAGISADPVDPAGLLERVARAGAGAAVVFVGTVRDHDPQATGEVVGLDYTCHPSAHDRIGGIVGDALAEAGAEPEARVAAVHRIGRLTVGEVAFVVAVSSAHRPQAFALCELVVERVKQHLPIWKQQFEADGSYRWSGL
ncbi:MAG: molybdenum cofactor biosynthesis protein MoaE [Propionibacteriaceae bacterium]|nr:molybdenum cofactor biosynthesis protein MoaE [Propionibacteriaceae bacterium]